MTSARMATATSHLMLVLLFTVATLAMAEPDETEYSRYGHHERIHYWDILMDRPWGRPGPLGIGAACTSNSQCASGGCRSGQCCVVSQPDGSPIIINVCGPLQEPCCGGCYEISGQFVCGCQVVNAALGQQRDNCATDQDCCSSLSKSAACRLKSGYKTCCYLAGSTFIGGADLCCSGSISGLTCL